MKLSIIFSLFITCTLFGQDSLFFKNGAKKMVKIEEIGTSTITYRSLENELTHYTIFKKELLMIKLSDGTIEPISYDEPIKSLNDSIVLKSGKFYQYNKPLSANRLLAVCEQKALISNSSQLQRVTKRAKQSIELQYKFGIAGAPFLAIGVLSFVAAAGGSFSDGPTNKNFINNSLKISGIAFICGISLEIPSFTFGLITHERRKKMVSAYNSIHI